MEDEKIMNEEIMDTEATEEEAPAVEDVPAEEAEPTPEPAPDYAGMIAELQVEIDTIKKVIMDLQDAYAIMVEAGATVRDDSPIAADEAEPTEEVFIPLEDMNFL